MRIAIAIIMILHGIAHLPGFIVPWRLGELKDMTYKTTLLSGRLDLGDTGIRVIGLFWLTAAAAFVTAGIGMIADSSWWAAALVCSSIVSLILGLLSLPEARIGVMLNAVILGVMMLSGVAGWTSQGAP